MTGYVFQGCQIKFFFFHETMSLKNFFLTILLLILLLCKVSVVNSVGPQKRFFSNSLVINNRLYLMGGNGDTGLGDNVDK